MIVCGLVADDQPSAEKKAGGGGPLGDLATAESMIQLALVLPAAVLIGWVVGAALDKHFGVGWIGVAGVLVGAVAGFVQIFRTASRFLKRGG